MLSLKEVQKMLEYPETKSTAEDEICFDEQEVAMITSIISCLKNYPVISAKDAQIITKYNNVIHQVILCLKKVSESSYRGENEVRFYFNNILPITKQILMCLGFEFFDIPVKTVCIKW